MDSYSHIKAIKSRVINYNRREARNIGRRVETLENKNWRKSKFSAASNDPSFRD